MPIWILEFDISEVRERGTMRGIIRFFGRLARERKYLGIFGALVTLLLLILAIFAENIAPYGMNEVGVAPRLATPSMEHILGADQLGRDLFSRIIYGARVSVIIGLSVSTVSMFISTAIGVLSGYFGGNFDLLVQRLVDAMMAFPQLVILILGTAVIGQGMWQLIVIMSLVQGFRGGRVIRSATMAVKGEIYVESAMAIGCPTWRIVLRHIVPQVMHLAIIGVSISVPGIILAEAGLSFLGLGVPPPNPSWGGMLSLEGRTYMLQNPGLAIWPGLCLTLVVFGVNVFGDAVRDLLDPKLKGGVGSYRKPKLAV